MQKMQNLRSNAGPFRPTLEKNVKINFDLESSQLSKNVRNMKIWRILAFWTTLVFTRFGRTLAALELYFTPIPSPTPLYSLQFHV